MNLKCQGMNVDILWKVFWLVFNFIMHFLFCLLVNIMFLLVFVLVGYLVPSKSLKSSLEIGFRRRYLLFNILYSFIFWYLLFVCNSCKYSIIIKLGNVGGFKGTNVLLAFISFVSHFLCCFV